MLSVTLGPISIPATLAMLYLGLLAAWFTGWLIARKRGVNPESALFGILLAGGLVARIAFVLRYWDTYAEHWLGMLDIRDGGFLAVPGIVGGVLAAVYYLWRRPNLRVPLISGLAVGVILAGIGLSISQAMLSSQKLPELALRDLQGNPVALQDYTGQPLVINLWATWCPPCRREMPVLQAAQLDNPDTLFVFVNQGEGQQLIEQFFTKQGISLDNVLLDTGARMGQAVGSLSLPTTLFYDADGLLQNNHLGELSKASLNHALRTITPSVPVKDNTKETP